MMPIDRTSIELRTMDWTPMVGRYRPVEQDAVRVLTVVDQLGVRPVEQPSAHREGRQDRAAERCIDTESQLQHLDHLVRHPIDLAYVAMDQIRSRGVELEVHLGDLARRARRLLGAAGRGRHRPSLLRSFDLGSWQRWDDVLAVLGCRGLLRVEPLPVKPLPVEPLAGVEDRGDWSAGELRYRVTAEGARWLQDAVYPGQGDQAINVWRERCELLRAVLTVDLLRPRSQGVLGAYLRETAKRLDDYCSDEQIQPEDDLLRRLFQSTFAEDL